MVRPGLEGGVDRGWCGWDFSSLEYFISWHLNFLAVECVVLGWTNALFQESLTPLSGHPSHLRWAILVSIVSFATKWVWAKFDIWKFPISKHRWNERCRLAPAASVGTLLPLLATVSYQQVSRMVRQKQFWVRPGVRISLLVKAVWYYSSYFAFMSLNFCIFKISMLKKLLSKTALWVDCHIKGP